MAHAGKPEVGLSIPQSVVDVNGLALDIVPAFRGIVANLWLAVIAAGVGTRVCPRQLIREGIAQLEME